MKTLFFISISLVCVGLISCNSKKNGLATTTPADTIAVFYDSFANPVSVKYEVAQAAEQLSDASYQINQTVTATIPRIKAFQQDLRLLDTLHSQVRELNIKYLAMMERVGIPDSLHQKFIALAKAYGNGYNYTAVRTVSHTNRVRNRDIQFVQAKTGKDGFARNRDIKFKTRDREVQFED